jgi:RNA polymerase sigma-70 factor (ECF subfamily)
MAKTRPDLAQASNPTQDTILLRRIREGDEGALSEFYDRHAGFVYSLARSVVRDDGDAEDIVQDVFFRIWERADTFDSSRGSALAWLTTVTRRLAIDRTRSRTFRARGREAPLDGVATPAARESGDATELSAEANEVLAALEKLEPAYREVIRLSYYEGLSHSGIASKLGTPLGTVKSRLREGVTQLRRILAVKTSS